MYRSILLFILGLSSAHAITLTQTVSSDVLFDLTPVAPTDAGDYFAYSYTRDKTLLTIDGIPNNQKWKVYARISNFVHGGSEKIRIMVKRTGLGTGVNAPTDGATGFIKLTVSSYKYFFKGEGSRFDIPVRTRIEGIGVYDDYGDFNTMIEYKVETY